MASRFRPRPSRATPSSSSNWFSICSIPSTPARAYGIALDQFFAWFQRTGPGGFSRATVQQYCRELIDRGLAASSVAQKLAAIRKLADGAASHGLLPPEVAAAVSRVHGPQSHGRRPGNWLTSEEAARLLRLPDRSTLAGKRDYTILAVALNTGLRRGEIVSLTVDHVRQRDGRWVLLDIVGKQNRVRTVPGEGGDRRVAGRRRRAGRPALSPAGRCRSQSKGLTAQAIYRIIGRYTALLGRVAAPHDLRRSHARLAFRAGAPLEQIQIALGHASLETTMRYIGCQQDFERGPCDYGSSISLRGSPLPHPLPIVMEPGLGFILYRDFRHGVSAEELAVRHGLAVNSTIMRIEAARLCYEHQIPMLREQIQSLHLPHPMSTG